MLHESLLPNLVEHTHEQRPFASLCVQNRGHWANKYILSQETSDQSAQIILTPADSKSISSENSYFGQNSYLNGMSASLLFAE